ncbi:VapI-like plasmid maintenance system antidote protein [Propionibacterium freudenreichii]|nr:VapI-like plasmid maintenance system antidote protein [Propionibacterium freudenreichii]CEH00064.1 VapI-like plasmid maintenance system antidote protein [Propionibacterium freudenreichii]CEI27943.1 VapI-like plasmid maintenance system antidote protein [Propionibacterium freudenreichii]
MPMQNPPHPGAILREDVVAALGLSVSEAAKKLGVSRAALSRVLNERAAVSPNLALRLEAAGVGTAQVWLTMQMKWELAQLRHNPPQDVERLATSEDAAA